MIKREMRSLTINLLVFVVVGLPVGAFSQVNPSGELVYELKSHFATLFERSNSHVHIEIIHLPKESIPTEYTFYFKKKKKLGHQTVWLTDNNYKKYPVTFFVSVDLSVLTATRKIKRGEELGDKNVELTTQRINRDWRKYLTSFDELNKMISVQLLSAGDPITNNLIRVKPDMSRGDDIKVQIISGDILVEANGKAIKDGAIGDEVYVAISKTGKRMYGEVISPTTVKVDLN